MELPGKIYIDVSWYPEHDPSGGYVVRVLQSRKVLGERESKSPHETIAIVEELCRRLCQPAAGCLAGSGMPLALRPRPQEFRRAAKPPAWGHIFAQLVVRGIREPPLRANMPRPITDTLCSESGAVDGTTGLTSHFNVIEQVFIQNAPPPPNVVFLGRGLTLQVSSLWND